MKPCNECHNCGAIWSSGSEEWDWQQCYACGWFPGQPIDDDEYDDDNQEDWEEDEK